MQRKQARYLASIVALNRKFNILLAILQKQFGLNSFDL